MTLTAGPPGSPEAADLHAAEQETVFSAQTPAVANTRGPLGPKDEELQRLRSLLFQREIAFIEDLRASLANPAAQAEQVSSVIAEALLLRSRQDDRLSIALEPLVDSIVRDALRANPEAFSSALFPLMGPSIRKSIAESFRSMLENFSKSMEMSFSCKGLRWRFEALRTGKPFGEVVLLHTLIYRVEEVFFIHSATGIDLMHVVNEGVDSQDANMVSAMLTAVQDFVNDSLANGKAGDLETLQHGEYTILLERGPAAYLACLVRGTPPANFREQIRSCLEHLLMEYYLPLSRFDGDTSLFAGSRVRLERLLASRYVDEGQPLPLWIKILLAGFCLGLLGGSGIWKWMDYRAQEQLREEERERHGLRQGRYASIGLLRGEAGLSILHVEPDENGPWEVFCLKDPLARDPLEVLREHDIDPSAFLFRITPYVSYEPDIVRQRVQKAILPPETVSMEFSDAGVLSLSGTAPMEWTLSARQTALALPGVRKVDTGGLADPRTTQLMSMIKLVEGTVVEFPSGKDIPVHEDMPKLTLAVETLVKLESLAARMGMAASLTVFGHADATGTDKRNYEISQARTKTIAAMLYARGSSMPIAMYGMGADYANREKGNVEDQASRRIEMRIHLVRAVNPENDQLGK
ncbi:MAG: hypothetical protein LBO77_00520 [Desulfovibrio sp.]|jgi:OOP family OmpA-OmpF porin|nr:hypothetical protein [Desulfovibrio sp.]